MTKEYVVEYRAKSNMFSGKPMPGTETPWGKKERVTRCRDCKKLDTMRCHVKRAIVFDLRESKQLKKNENPPCICPAGFCAWAEPKEEA